MNKTVRKRQIYLKYQIDVFYCCIYEFYSYVLNVN